MIAESPTLPVQEAIFERASLDVELGAAVHDHVPEGAQRPYVVVGEAFTTPDNTHSGFGWETVATLSIWVQERGFRQAHQIKNRLIQLFDHQPLPIPGFHTVVVKFEFDQMMRDPNPTLRRALLRLRVITEQDRE